MQQPYQMTLAQSAREIQSGNLSPVDLARDLLDRISSLDPALQAWVTVDREAVLGAAEDRERDLHNGTTLGPIHGAPVGLKDIFYTQGMKTTGLLPDLRRFRAQLRRHQRCENQGVRRHCPR